MKFSIIFGLLLCIFLSSAIEPAQPKVADNNVEVQPEAAKVQDDQNLNEKAEKVETAEKADTSETTETGDGEFKHHDEKSFAEKDEDDKSEDQHMSEEEHDELAK